MYPCTLSSSRFGVFSVIEETAQANGFGTVMLASNRDRNFVCRGLPPTLDTAPADSSLVPTEPLRASEGNKTSDPPLAMEVAPLLQNRIRFNKRILKDMLKHSRMLWHLRFAHGHQLQKNAHDQVKQAIIRRGHDRQASELPEVSDKGIRSSFGAQTRDSRTSSRVTIPALFNQPRIRGSVLLNILTVLYGSNATVIKQAETIIDPALFSTGRFLVATLAFSPYLWCALKDDTIRKRGLELGLLASIGYLSQSVGLLTTDAGRAAFICAFTVIVVPLLAGLSGSHIPKNTWFSAIAALIGIGFLESGGAPASVGDIWSLVSAISFGYHMLRSEQISRALPSASVFPLLSVQLLVTTMCSAIWAIFNHINELPATDALGWHGIPSLWLPMLYTGLLSTAFCLWVELVALRNVSSSEAAIIYTLEPLWGAGFAWFFLGERWGALGWIGALCILGASLSTQLFADAEIENPDLPLPVHPKRKETLEIETPQEDTNGGYDSSQKTDGSYNSHRARSKLKSNQSIWS